MPARRCRRAECDRGRVVGAHHHGPRSPQPQVSVAAEVNSTTTARQVCKVCRSVIQYHSILAQEYGLSRSPVLFWNYRLSTMRRDERGRLPWEHLFRTIAPPPASTPPEPETAPPRTTMPLPGFPAPELSVLAGPPQDRRSLAGVSGCGVRRRSMMSRHTQIPSLAASVHPAFASSSPSPSRSPRCCPSGPRASTPSRPTNTRTMSGMEKTWRTAAR